MIERGRIWTPLRGNIEPTVADVDGDGRDIA